MKRHPELSLRSADPLSYCWYSSVSQSSQDYYFSLLLKDSLEDGGLMEMPSYIYNMDETGMSLDHKQLKRITPREIKMVHGLRKQDADHCPSMCQCCRYNVTTNGNLQGRTTKSWVDQGRSPWYKIWYVTQGWSFLWVVSKALHQKYSTFKASNFTIRWVFFPLQPWSCKDSSWKWNYPVLSTTPYNTCSPAI